MRRGKASLRDRMAAWTGKVARPTLLLPLILIVALAVPSLFPGLLAGQAGFVSAYDQIELVTNGGFESGLVGWVSLGDFHADPGFPYPHSGARYAYLTNADGTPGNNLYGTMYQAVSIPSSATSATLTFWYNITTQETGSTPRDVLYVTIQDSTGNYLATVAIFDNGDSQPIGVYSQKSFNMTPYTGQTIRIDFLGTTDGSLPTVFRIDDVSILATLPSLPDPPSLISPSNGATDVSLTPTFQWSSVSNADYYGLYISEPPYGPDHLVFDSEEDYGPIYGTSFPLPSGILEPGVRYYWNMRSHNIAGWGDFSLSWSFTPNQPPTCSLSADPRSGNVPLTVTFSMSASDPDGSISIWGLDIDGDGDANYYGLGNPPSTKQHTYMTPGSYSVIFMVLDNHGASAFDIVTITVSESPPENRPPTARASDISGQPQTMYPDTVYSVTARYYDPDGRNDLRYCYLQLRHPSKPLTMMWNQSDGSYSPWAGEEGANYLTITNVTSTELTNGYELTWNFKINDSWPQAENSIDFGVSARDDNNLESGWDYDNTNASFIVNQPPHQPTNLSQFKADGATAIPVGGTTNESTVVFKGMVSDPDNDQVKLQIELRRLDEYGGEFDETEGGFKESNFVETGSKAVAYAYGLVNGDYHWRARSIDEHGKASDWVDFGDNDISDADFDRPPPVLLVHGLELPLYPSYWVGGEGNWSFNPVKMWEEMGEVLTGIGKEGQVADTVPGHSFWKLEKRSEDGLTVYISNYTRRTTEPALMDIRFYSYNLAEEIQAIKADENVNEVDIVGHSMGGLVARAYVENEDFEDNPYGTEYRNDARTLIMLGTPNQGVDLARIYSYLPDFPPGTSPDQMRPGSDFLQHLNSGITGENYTTIAGIECSYCIQSVGIGSVAFCREDCISKGKEGIGSDKSYVPLWFSAEDVRLEGAVPYSYLLADHTELRTKARVGELVMDILAGERIDVEGYWDISEHRARLFFKCPVNITITDQYGRVIDDQGTNEIPGADIEAIGEEKFFHLPPDLPYDVGISAYDVGDFTVVEASPVTTDTTLVNVFNNIPVTNKTKATLKIVPDEMDRLMEIDYDGDGVIDEEKGPDASEMIGDTTPPSAVTDLAASDPTCNTITLTWTAPGDDGNTGIAKAYDIRHSTLPITEDNWDEATQCGGEPTPQTAGSSETFAVTGLCCGTTYYFAIRTADEVPNWSGLSNIAVGTTRPTIYKVYLPLILKNYPPDTTPPAPVTNLSTSNPTLDSITLNWTAPGDDGNTGTAWKYDIRWSTSPITDANWPTAAQCAGEPVPKPAGSSETFTVHGLAPNTTYYFALKTADEVPNWSGLSNVASGTTVLPDTTPPATVTNLRTSNPTLDSITLNWTAPGDDGNTGTAWKYDVRFSTSPITDANWNAAAQCAGEPAPKPAGSSEAFTVRGLTPNTTYYFALKTADEVSNWSGLSNVASGATLRPSDQLIINCGFETDEGWLFGESPRPAAYTTEDAHWGARSVRLGIKPPTTDAYSWSSVRQRITIPANAKSATLSFWYKPFSEAPCWSNWQQFDWSDYRVDQPGRIPPERNLRSWSSCDWQQAFILADDFPKATILATVMNISSNSRVWTNQTFDLMFFRGQTVWIYFNVYNNGSGYGRTWMYVDDASVMVYY